MNQTRFVYEATRRLTRIYELIKSGQPADPVMLHRVEGFMNAGVFLGLLTNQELNHLIEEVHLNVLGESVQNRQKQSLCRWQPHTPDYSCYETPTYERAYRRQTIETDISLHHEK